MSTAALTALVGQGAAAKCGDLGQCRANERGTSLPNVLCPTHDGLHENGPQRVIYLSA